MLWQSVLFKSKNKYKFYPSNSEYALNLYIGPDITSGFFHSPDEGSGSLVLQDSIGEDSVLLDDCDSIADSRCILDISLFFLSSFVTDFDSCCSCEQILMQNKVISKLVFYKITLRYDIM